MNIEENAENYIPNDENSGENINNENGYPNEGNEQKKESNFWSMLKAQTGEGSIKSYSNHPLNMKNNDYVGQIIRGLTGMLGTLNFAILDILLGSFGFIKEKKDVTDYSISDVETENPINKGKPNVVNGIRYV
jgi:hypothetical protein